MNRKILYILATIVSIFPQVKAQNDSINAYLLTCEPGRAIYELYGHSAIWIEEEGKGYDEVFNYGLFSFDSPHFVLNFTLGKTDYLLGSERLEYFMQEYKERGSVVYAQKLNLSHAESRRLYDLLIENKRPQNRVYRYDFLYKNCATMAIDKIEQCISGSITYRQSSPDLSFRDILTEHNSVRPWSEFAIDLVIGAEADRPLEYRQEAFAPRHLMSLASGAVITDTTGVSRPLVQQTLRLVNPDHSVDFGKPLFTPLQVAWIVLLTVLLLSLIGWYTNRSFWLVDAILFGIQGLGGIVIALLFFFSEHPTVDSNWLVICFNPLPLLFLPFMIIRSRHGRVPVFAICEFAVCSAFLLLSPVKLLYAERIPLADTRSSSMPPSQRGMFHKLLAGDPISLYLTFPSSA